MKYDTITGLPQPESFFSFSRTYMQRENVDRFAFLALHIHARNSKNNPKKDSDRYALLSLVQKFVRRQDYILSAYRHDSQVLVCLLDTSLLTDCSLEHALFHAKELFISEMSCLQPSLCFLLKGGICFYRDGDSVTDSVQHALSALQIALDAKGKDDFHIYSPEAASDFDAGNHILPLFDNSFTTKRHTLIYLQPRFLPCSAQPCSAQVLVRILDNSGKVFNPGSFLPVLEQKELLTNLDLTVVERVLQLISHWQETIGFPCNLSIHLSDVSLQSASFYHIMEQLMEKYAAAFPYLTLEVSADAFLQNQTALVSFIRNLHQVGGKTDIEFSRLPDDLSVSCFLGTDGITCNRNFLLHTLYDRDNHTITGDFIESFENCKVSTICKGIETSEEAEFAKSCHFSQLQGFLYGRPIPIDIFQKKYMGFVVAPFA